MADIGTQAFDSHGRPVSNVRANGEKHTYVKKITITLPDGTKKEKQIKRTLKATNGDDARVERERRFPSGSTPTKDADKRIEPFFRAAIKRYADAGLLDEGTVEVHTNRFDTNILPTIGNKLIQDITPEDCAKVPREMKETGYTRGEGEKQQQFKYSPNTRVQAVATMLWIFEAAMSSDYEYITVNPAAKIGVDKPKPRKRKVPKLAVFQEGEVERLLAATRHNVIYWMLFFLLLHTGLRMREALALRISDVNFLTGHLRVERQLRRKKKAGEDYGSKPLKMHAKDEDDEDRDEDDLSYESGRTLKLTTALLAKLDTYVHTTLVDEGLYSQSGYLFPTTGWKKNQSRGLAISAHNVGRAFRLCKAKAEITRKEIVPHSFRHTFVTEMYKTGVEQGRGEQTLMAVSAAIGHTNVKTTRERYAHWMPNKAEEQHLVEVAALALPDIDLAV